MKCSPPNVGLLRSCPTILRRRESTSVRLPDAAAALGKRVGFAAEEKNDSNLNKPALRLMEVVPCVDGSNLAGALESILASVYIVEEPSTKDCESYRLGVELLNFDSERRGELFESAYSATLLSFDKCLRRILKMNAELGGLDEQDRRTFRELVRRVSETHNEIYTVVNTRAKRIVEGLYACRQVAKRFSVHGEVEAFLGCDFIETKKLIELHNHPAILENMRSEWGNLVEGVEKCFKGEDSEEKKRVLLEAIKSFGVASSERAHLEEFFWCLGIIAFQPQSSSLRGILRYGMSYLIEIGRDVIGNAKPIETA